MKKLIFLISVPLLTIGCQTTTEDYNRLQKQINELQKQQSQDKSSLEEDITDLQQEVAALHEQTQEALEETSGQVRSTQADLWSTLESQKVELANIRGTQEEIRFRLNNFEQMTAANEQEFAEMHKELQELDTRVAQIVSQLGLDIEAAARTDDEQEPEDPAQNIYEQALDSFNQKEYQQAINLWSDFAEEFPEHELVSNAYFWQGESYYQLQNYAQAVLKYQEVVENHPDSSKYPTSLLKQGLCFYQLEKKQAGEILLQELIEDYPETAEAQRAESFLDQQ